MDLGDRQTRADTSRRALWGALKQPGKETAAERGRFPLMNRAIRIAGRL